MWRGTDWAVYLQDGHEEEWDAETVAELISKETTERRINTVPFPWNLHKDL